MGQKQPQVVPRIKIPRYLYRSTDAPHMLVLDVYHLWKEVTDIVSSPDAVWVGTQGGHLIAFNPISTDVVLVHQRHSSISCIVSLDTQQQLVTFGLAEVEGEEDGDTLGTFTVWTSFVHVDQ